VTDEASYGQFRDALGVLGQLSPSTIIKNIYGEFRILYHRGAKGGGCLSCTPRQATREGVAVVRIHSACLLGESFYSSECDCRQQLDASYDMIATSGGALIYLFQEGRGIGVPGKILAMELERVKDLGTAQAFKLLGYNPDPRSYDAAVAALRDLGLSSDIRLITNNPGKIRAVEEAGFRVVERLEPKLRINRRTVQFLRNKERALGHIPYENIELVDA
jgi:GTP cyclohydrolase II